MKHWITWFLLWPSMQALGCARCAPVVRAAIFDGHFWFNLALILMPAAMVGLVALVLHRFGDPP